MTMFKLFTKEELIAHSNSVMDANRSYSYLWHAIIHANSDPLINFRNEDGKIVKHMTAADIKRLVGAKYFDLLPIRKDKGEKKYKHNRAGSAEMFVELQSQADKYDSICDMLESEFDGVAHRSANDESQTTFNKFVKSIEAYIKWKKDAQKEKRDAEKKQEAEEKATETATAEAKKAQREQAIKQSLEACLGDALNPYGQNEQGWKTDFEEYQAATKAAALMKDNAQFADVYAMMLEKLEELSSDLRLADELKEHTPMLEEATA